MLPWVPGCNPSKADVLVGMVGWDDVAFMHFSFVPYLSPPDVVCLVLTSREGKVFDTADSWRTVTRSVFGAAGGPRGHLSRRQRKKKVVW